MLCAAALTAIGLGRASGEYVDINSDVQTYPLTGAECTLTHTESGAIERCVALCVPLVSVELKLKGQNKGLGDAAQR